MLEFSLPPGVTGAAQVSVAGDTWNTAVYAKRASGDNLTVDYVTALGADPISERMITAASEEGIGASLIVRHQTKHPGLYALINNELGERSFVYWRSDSAARTLFDDDEADLAAALFARHAWYYSAISLAILSPAGRRRLLDAAAAHRNAGGVVIFDSNYRPALWQSRGDARDWIERAWRLCDVALPSLDDEIALFGDENENAALARLTSFGVTFGALKRGARGPRAIGWDDHAVAYEPAATVVDTSAAGDSFNGAFIAALAAGALPAEAARAGHRMAKAVIGVKGAIIPREMTPSVL